MATTKPVSHAELYTTNNPSPSDIETLLDSLSTSYLDHPLTTAFITEIDSTRSPSQATLTPSRLKSYFSQGIHAVARSDVLVTFAYPQSQSDPQPDLSSSTRTPLAAALFEPPSFTGTPDQSAPHPPPGPILTSYRTLSSSLKTQHLSIPVRGPAAYAQPAAPSQSSAAPTEDPYPGDFNKDTSGAAGETRAFYHLAFLARTHRQGESAEAVAELIAEFQGRAGAEQVPIWCVVGTEAERVEFEGLGFRVVETAVVGKGVVDEKGWPGGKDMAGVRVWAMVWEAAVEAV